MKKNATDVQHVATTDVTALAVAMGEARRARYGLPVAIGMQAILSLFAFSAGGGFYDMINGFSVIAAVAAALVLVAFDAAMIRGREGLRCVLFVFIATSVLATFVNAYLAVQVVRPIAASGRGIPAFNEALDSEQIFVGMFALLSWLILMINHRAAKALAVPISDSDKKILSAARAGWRVLRMGLRTLLASILALAFAIAFIMTVALLRIVPLDDVITEIQHQGLARMARELVVGLGSGETAAIGVTAVLLIGLVILVLAGHRKLAPGRSPVNRMWRWARDARAALHRDARPPVLLLRSFADEALSTAEQSSDFGTSIENVVARPVAGRGPFIAVGMPGEVTPAGPAYRAYLKDGEWQAAVLDWMDKSQLVVVILGRTPWVRWELENLRDLGHLTKSLIMLPPSNKLDRVARWENFKAICENTPWQEAIGEVRSQDDLLMLKFWPEGRLRIVRSGKLGRDDYHSAVLAGGLKPFQ